MVAVRSSVALLLLMLSLSVGVTFASLSCSGSPSKVGAMMNPWNAGLSRPLPMAELSCSTSPNTAGVLPHHINITGKSMIEFVNVTGGVRVSCCSFCAGFGRTGPGCAPCLPTAHVHVLTLLIRVGCHVPRF